MLHKDVKKKKKNQHKNQQLLLKEFGGIVF